MKPRALVPMATSLLEYKTLQKKRVEKRKKDIIGLNLVKHICRATDVSYKVNIEHITNPNSCEQERICLSDKTQGRVVFSFCFFVLKFLTVTLVCRRIYTG